MLTVLKNLFKRIGQKLGLVETITPKQVQARVLNPDVAYGAPLKPRAVVRVISGASKDNWIKEI